jgi:hypothetical protein
MSIVIFIFRLLFSIAFVYIVIFINVLLIGISVLGGFEWYAGYKVLWLIVAGGIQTLLGIK